MVILSDELSKRGVIKYRGEMDKFWKDIGKHGPESLDVFNFNRDPIRESKYIFFNLIRSQIFYSPGCFCLDLFVFDIRLFRIPFLIPIYYLLVNLIAPEEFGRVCNCQCVPDLYSNQFCKH